MSLHSVLARRPGGAQALRFDTSGALEVFGLSPIAASDVVCIRDVWAVLGRDLDLGELTELACSDGRQSSLYIREWSGETLALVEGPTEEDLGNRAVDVCVLLERERDHERERGTEP